MLSARCIYDIMIGTQCVFVCMCIRVLLRLCCVSVCVCMCVSGRNIGRHLGAVIDAWGLVTIPPAFILYLILELSGHIIRSSDPDGAGSAHSPHKLSFKQPDPKQPAMIEFIDKRSKRCVTRHARASARQCCAHACQE